MNKIKADENISEMKSLQEQILNLNIIDDVYFSEKENEDTEMGETVLKHKKRNDETVQPVVVVQKKIL